MKNLAQIVIQTFISSGMYCTEPTKEPTEPTVEPTEPKNPLVINL